MGGHDPDRYFDAEIETIPRSELEAIQEERILELVPWAYENSALYRQVWSEAGVHPRDIKSTADFKERIPFINKDTVRAFRDAHHDPFGGLLCVDASELSAVNSTSGTTGDPTLVAEQWGNRSRGASSPIARDIWSMGIRPGDFFVIMLFTFRGPTYSFAHLVGATPLIVDHSPTEWDRFFDLVDRYRPTGMYTLSQPLMNSLWPYEQQGVDLTELFSSFKTVVFAGEPLGQRAAAQVKRFRIPLFEHSAAGDVGAAFECPAHNGLHVWEDYGLYECIDPEATSPADAVAVVDGGVGELVATNLDQVAMPLIRYRSDDLDRFTRAPCTCGRTHARLWTLGRKGDETVVGDRSVLPRDVWAGVEAIDECAFGLFQIIRPQRRVDALRLRVGYAGTPNLADLAERVRQSVASTAGVEPEVELVPNEELMKLGPPHKIPRVAKV